MKNTKQETGSRVFHLEQNQFKADDIKISSDKWMEWVGIPKWKDLYEDYCLGAPFYCHEEVEKKHSLCWN